MEDKKTAKIMIYQKSQIFFGDITVNKNISLAHYLQNSHQSAFLSIINAKSISFMGNSALKPISYKEIHIPFDKVIASHFLPPYIEAYQTGSDVELSNRQEIDITIGQFIFRGNVVFSNQISLIQYINRQSSSFLTLSDVKIIHQTRKDFKKISTPYSFIKISDAIYGVR